MANLSPDKIKRVYGRRQSRPLNKDRKAAFDALMPELGIDEAILREDHSLDPASLFPERYENHWLEIGFGNGEHVSGLMQRHPKTGYLAAEPFINGMAAFLKDIKPLPCRNVRVLMDDAMMLGRSLAPESLEGIYILNPDPWHKKRHHKRRIVNPDNLDTFAKILKPGGQLIMSTDVPYLAEWMLTHSFNHPAFEWEARRASGWKTPPADWISTRYERKRAKGADQMCYLFFRKTA